METKESKRITVQCETCGRDIVKYASDVARSRTGRFFCNTKCKGNAGGKPRTGEFFPCATCGKDFYRRQHQIKANRRYCSKPCYDKGQTTRGTETRRCENCGNDFEFKLSMSDWNAGRFCSKSCLHEFRRKAAIGGKKTTSDGYIVIFHPDSPSAQPSTGYVYEHRYVMEQKLGRALLPGENIHHKNGDRGDNRIENLELWTTSQPSGQRVSDKLAWAREMIETYADYEFEDGLPRLRKIRKKVTA